MEDRIEYYNQLMTLPYLEVVSLLLTKYGPSPADYFSEKSYERFLNNEIKSIANGKYSRTKEGLYAHHIDEDTYENICSLEYIKHFKYPFELQKKERLVYCNLVEHLILHALIAKETNHKYGYKGYVVYIRPMFIEWYITEQIPQDNTWHKCCYDAAYLNPIEADTLLTAIDKLVPTRDSV